MSWLVIRSLALEIGLDTRLSKHNSPVALQFWGRFTIVSLSFSRITFVQFARIVEISLHVVSAAAALLLLLSLRCCRRLKRRSPWTCLFIGWPIFGEEMQRTCCDCAVSSNMFEALSNLPERRRRFARAQVPRLTIIAFSLMSLLRPLLLSSFLFLRLLPIVIVFVVAVHC